MSDEQTGTSQTDQPRTEEDVESGHEALVQQLRDGVLRNNVKVILVLGYAGAGKSNLLKILTGDSIAISHGLSNGTERPVYVPVTLDGERYIFMDTPGFGTTQFPAKEVKSLIHSRLGYATRCFGGIHGVVYVHNITTEREYAGLSESLDFLRQLRRENRLPRLTFVTTNWDLAPPELPFLRQKYEGKLAELQSGIWADFSGHGHVQVGFSYDLYPAERRPAAKASLARQLAESYANAQVVPINMPFWQGTWKEIGQTTAFGASLVAASPVLVPLAIIGFVVDEIGRGGFTVNGEMRVGFNTRGELVVDHNFLDPRRPIR